MKKSKSIKPIFNDTTLKEEDLENTLDMTYKKLISTNNIDHT